MDEDAPKSRRQFLKVFSTGVGITIGMIVGVPFVDAVVAPSLRTKKSHFARLAPLDKLPVGNPVDRTIADRTTDAFIQETVLHDVWVVKHSASKVDVFSPICPHLGCRYEWHGDEDHFVCPCHGSVFEKTGEVVSGPAPRGLDTLPIRIEKGEIYVEWERFKVGIPKKVRV
ncbi:MAG: ubiquinol-cytochrome c reductase iron-sulfur subunit [Gemmatimonadota bacterium]|jgi:menaquinol-cytochrome c reductase iron-sulfur subunit